MSKPNTRKRERESTEEAIDALIEKGYLIPVRIEGDPEVYLVPTGKQPPVPPQLKGKNQKPKAGVA